jgi:hypothetical protein
MLSPSGTGASSKDALLSAIVFTPSGPVGQFNLIA